MTTPLNAVRPLDVPTIDALRAGEVRHALGAAGIAGSLLALTEEVAGASPFLSRLMLQHSEWLAGIAANDPGRTLAELLATLDGTELSLPEADIAMVLRDARERVALLVALADCGGLWDIGAATRALSDHADASCRLAWEWGEAETVRRRQLPADREARGRGFLLALGKGGARELNYSSDIDIVAFYERPQTGDPYGELTAGWVAVARKLTRLLGAPEGGRIVHRVDWRLRPDPGATPLAIPTAAAMLYYQNQARSWERLAYIKARTVAGDCAAGHAFLAELEPFVWRRSLDFTIAPEMARMAARIRDAKGQERTASDLEGWDVKTGRGGIREIEFLVQSQQTIRGGRDARLRTPATLDALGALTRAGALGADDAGALEDAYRHYRDLEHRLQMIADQQTQLFPPPGTDRDRAAALMGMGATELVGTTQRHREGVATIFDRILDVAEPAESDAPAHGALAALDAPGGDGNDPGADALQSLGFEEPIEGAATLRGWLAGRPPSLRSPLAREAFEAVLPRLLDSIAGAHDPDQALRTLDRMIVSVPSGLQLFSMLQARPALCDLLARILSDAPTLAERMARDAAVLAGAGEASFWQPPEREAVAVAVEGLVRASGGLEATMDAVRLVHRTEEFRLALRLLEGLDAASAGTDATVVVDACLDALFRATCAERGVEPDESGLAIVAMGRYGAHETTAASDLDLLVIARDMDAAERGTRLVRTLLAAITSPTAEGRFREVDMRLRPSGNAGPLVTTLPGFQRHHEGAEAWELIALGRARPVAGDPAVVAAVASALRAIRNAPRDRAALVRGARDVLARVRAERPALGSFDVKNRAGGLFAIEYAVHLAHAVAPFPEREAETRTAALIAMLDHPARDELADVHAALSGALQMLTALGGGIAAPAPPPALDRAFGGDAARGIEAWLARGEGAVAQLWEALDRDATVG